MKDWPEKPYLEPKTAGRTYLEWLYYRERQRSTAHSAKARGPRGPARAVSPEPAHQAKLLSFARLYKRHGRRCLSQWHQLPPGVSWEALEVALKASSSTGWRRRSQPTPSRLAAATRGEEALMKLIIAGSRTFTDYQLLCQTLAPERHRITQVLTGGARGADQLGYRWAWKHQVKHQLFRADWERFGKSAGVRRNSPDGAGRRHAPGVLGWALSQAPPT